MTPTIERGIEVRSHIYIYIYIYMRLRPLGFSWLSRHVCIYDTNTIFSTRLFINSSQNIMDMNVQLYIAVFINHESKFVLNLSLLNHLLFYVR